MSWDVLQGRRKKRQKPWRQRVSRQPRLDKLQRGTKLPRWLLTVCCSTQTGNMGRIFLVSYPILHLAYISWCFVLFFWKRELFRFLHDKSVEANTQPAKRMFAPVPNWKETKIIISYTSRFSRKGSFLKLYDIKKNCCFVLLPENFSILP